MERKTAIQKLQKLADEFSGVLGVYAKHMSTGDELGINEAETFETASTIKVPVLIEVYRQAELGHFSLDDQLVFEEQNYVKGSGVLRDLSYGSDGVSMTVRDACVLMMIVSDNFATNQLIDLVGQERVNRLCVELGLERTRLLNPIRFTPGSTPEIGTTTPMEFSRLFEGLYREVIVTPAACQDMLQIMSRNHYKTTLVRYLPEELLRPETPDDDPSVRIASKSGTLKGIKNNAGVVWTPEGDFTLSIFTKESKDESWGVDSEAQVAMPRAARVVFDYFFNKRQH